MLHLDKEKFRVGMRTIKSGVAVGLCTAVQTFSWGFSYVGRFGRCLCVAWRLFIVTPSRYPSCRWQYGCRYLGGSLDLLSKIFWDWIFSVDFFGTIIAVIILITVCNILDLSTAIVGATATFSCFLQYRWYRKDHLRHPKGTGHNHRHFHRHRNQLPFARCPPNASRNLSICRKTRKPPSIGSLRVLFSFYSTDLSASIMSTCFSLRCMINMTTLENNADNRPEYR